MSSSVASRIKRCFPSANDDGKGAVAPFPLQGIAEVGACRKAPGMAQNHRLTPNERISTDVNASAFALPDNLATKNEPSLIDTDEAHFAAIARSLEESIDDLTERIEETLKLPGGTGQAAM